jgi:hypothetical protein
MDRGIWLNLMETPWAYGVTAVTILIDIYLLYIFFRKKSGVRATTSAGSAGTPRSEWSA